MTLKLSRAGASREPALDTIDRHFASLINAEIGPLGALHALKRAQALAGAGELLDDDAETILGRAAEQDARLAEIDRQRRMMKNRVRDAATAADIKSILAELLA